MTNQLANTPFLVTNGNKFEIHDYSFDADGRRWEITVAGPFNSEQEARNALGSA